MLRFLALILPSMVSLSIYEKLQNKPLSYRQSIILGGLFVLANTIVMLMFLVLRGHGERTLGAEMVSNSFMLQYLILSSVIGVLLPYVFMLLGQFNIHLRVLSSDHERKNE